MKRSLKTPAASLVLLGKMQQYNGSTKESGRFSLPKVAHLAEQVREHRQLAGQYLVSDTKMRDQG